LYKADIVLKFWLPMGGLGHCRNLKMTYMKSLINVKQWVRNQSKSGKIPHFSDKVFKICVAHRKLKYLKGHELRF
jgi:hypothetical protein